jgi:uncharacterized protein YceH (UPF0502 family)
MDSSLCSQLSRMAREEQELLREIKQVQNQLDRLSSCDRGTLQVKFIRCGKPNCYCAKTGKRHGPYYYLERRVCGKVRTVYIGRNKNNVGHHNIQQKAIRLRKRLRSLKSRQQELHGEIITQLRKGKF